MKVRMNITGSTALLMHNARLSDPLDPITKRLKEVSSKRTKTDDDQERMARIEFEGGLYFDEAAGPYIPGINIHRCLVEAAKLNKLGRHVERGVIALDEVCPVGYHGPRAIDEMWADKNFVSRLSVGVTTSRVMRTRPMFRTWVTEADFLVDNGQIDLPTFTEIAEKAGVMIGLGDYRPRFGRFEAVVEKIED
jgi:hypothetical protein